MKVSRTLKNLFVSQTRTKLINIFFGQVKELFYVRQLVRLTGEEINSVRRELKNLKDASLLCSEIRGNRVYYWANPKAELFNDLLVLANKTSGFAHHLLDSKPKVGQIKLLFFSHSFLTRHPVKCSDIDFILVGDVSTREIEKLVKDEETSLNREINYMIMTPSELRLRQQKRDPFIVDFFLFCPSVIIGSPADLT